MDLNGGSVQAGKMDPLGRELRMAAKIAPHPTRIAPRGDAEGQSVASRDHPYPRPTKATPAQMMITEIHRVGLIGSLKHTFDIIMTSTYPRLTVG